MNWISLRGMVARAPEYSHTSHDKRFYTLWMDVARLSGYTDRLRALLPETLLEAVPLLPDVWIELQGQLRSFNNKSGAGSRLVISALGKTLAPASSQEPYNRVMIGGSLCRAPVYRKTPLGREICDVMLAVPRGYGRTDYLPMIAWGHTARVCAEWEAGHPLFAEGRFQSRQYTKVIEEQSIEKTAYEVSVIHMAESEEELVLGEKTGEG